MVKSKRLNISHNRSSRRRGTAFLEFFLVAPLLGLLAAGIIQYGLIASTAASLTNISREGARFAALSNTTTDAAIIDHVKTAAASTRVKPEDLTITINPVEADRKLASQVGQKVTITLKYDLGKQLFVPGTQFISNNFKADGQPGFYKTQSTMRIQPS